MYCIKCGDHMARCQCPDAEERLIKLLDNPRCQIAAAQNLEMRRRVQAQDKKDREAAGGDN